MSGYPGWIVGVEDEAGDLLYAVALEDALAAVDLVRAELAIDAERQVWPQAPATQEKLAAFRLRAGEMRGPM